jgi:hypothetical protein
LIPMLRPAVPNLTGIRKPHELGQAAYAAASASASAEIASRSSCGR